MKELLLVCLGWGANQSNWVYCKPDHLQSISIKLAYYVKNNTAMVILQMMQAQHVIRDSQHFIFF
jgi:hypothetical protein